MGSSLGGITRNGSSGSYTYSAIPGRENMPVNGVSFWSATRFSNWLHNGKPTGAQNDETTEDGAYTLTPTAIANNMVTRNVDAKFFVPNEDEWYKAAYYKGGGTQAGYWTYPVESTPENWPHPPGGVMMICSTPTTAPSTGNCAWKISDFSAVGSYPSAPSASGTFDQGGNAWEWSEAIIADENRTLRGGSFVSPASGIGTQIRHRELPSLQAGYVGFRIASLAPVSVPALNPLGVATLCTLLGLAGHRRLRG
jgi:formylglycine-generating enzyme required for sulfatase activity